MVRQDGPGAGRGRLPLYSQRTVAQGIAPAPSIGEQNVRVAVGADCRLGDDASELQIGPVCVDPAIGGGTGTVTVGPVVDRVAVGPVEAIVENDWIRGAVEVGRRRVVHVDEPVTWIGGPDGGKPVLDPVEAYTGVTYVLDGDGVRDGRRHIRDDVPGA